MGSDRKDYSTAEFETARAADAALDVSESVDNLTTAVETLTEVLKVAIESAAEDIVKAIRNSAPH